jgi:hypothetical protein
VTGKNNFKYYTASGGLSTITDISAVSFSNTNTALTYNGTMPTYYPRFISTSRQLTVAVDYVTSPYVLISSTGPTGFASATGTFTGASTWKWSVVESKLNFILVGSTTANKAYYSTDNGSTWNNLSGVDPYTNSGIIAATSAIVNDKIYIYLATLDGVVYLSTFTVSQTASSAPSEPTGLSVSTGSTSATISFSAPATQVQSYTITAVATNPSYENTVSQTFTSGSGYVLKWLAPGTTYTFTLTATNSNGSASSSVSATTKTVSIPASPTFSAVQAGAIPAGAINFTYVPTLAVPKNNPAYVYISGSGADGIILKSTDYGKTFRSNIGTKVFPYYERYLNWRSLICSDDGKYVYTGNSNGWIYYMLYRSSDYGETFYPVFSKYTNTNGYYDKIACECFCC